MLCQQPIPPIFQAAPLEQHHPADLKGLGTVMPVLSYTANANLVGITVILTMGCTVPPDYSCTHPALTPAPTTHSIDPYSYVFKSPCCMH